VVQLTLISGKAAGTKKVIRRFPFSVGRNPKSDFRVEEAGVWDEHLSFSLTTDAEVELTLQPGALASVNGVPITQTALRSGDVIAFGAAQLEFALSTTRQKSLVVREAAVWISLALLCLVQVALVYWLLG
jgi:pSer/pThr/pTyr-binding forkhead associated (FHA) protein